MVHTMIMMLSVIHSSVLCSGITRKAQEHSMLPGRNQFNWNSEDGMTCTFSVPISLSLSESIGDGHMDPTATVVFLPCSSSPSSSDICLLHHVCSGQEDSLVLVFKASRVSNDETFTCHPVSSWV